MSELIDLTEADEPKRSISIGTLSKRVSESLGIDQPARKRARLDPGLGAVAEAAPAPAAAPQEPAPPASEGASNNLLAQLHAERLARMSAGGRGPQAAASSAPPALQSHPAVQHWPPSAGQLSLQPQLLQASANTVSSSASGAAMDKPSQPAGANFTFLNLNIGFRDNEFALQARANAISSMISEFGFPSVLMFQEVTASVLKLWQASAWWHLYQVSPVPSNRKHFPVLAIKRTAGATQHLACQDYSSSSSGCALAYASVQFANCRPLIVATTQLECPEAGRDTSHQRAEQLQEALQQLSNLAACVAASQESSGSPSAPSVSACCDVVLAGDLQWSDAKDGALKLLPGWADAWPDVRPTLQQQAPAPAPASGSSSSSASAASSTGTTFDARGNTLLASGVYRGAWTGPRPDRVLACLSSGSWQMSALDLVATRPIPGVKVPHPTSAGQVVPVMPSTHYGLMVKLTGAPYAVQAQAQPAPATAAPAPAAILGKENSRPVAVTTLAPVSAATKPAGSKPPQQQQQQPAAVAIVIDDDADAAPAVATTAAARPPRASRASARTAAGPVSGAAAGGGSRSSRSAGSKRGAGAGAGSGTSRDDAVELLE